MSSITKPGRAQNTAPIIKFIPEKKICRDATTLSTREFDKQKTKTNSGPPLFYLPVFSKPLYPDDRQSMKHNYFVTFTQKLKNSVSLFNMYYVNWKEKKKKQKRQKRKQKVKVNDPIVDFWRDQFNNFFVYKITRSTNPSLFFPLFPSQLYNDKTRPLFLFHHFPFFRHNDIHCSFTIGLSLKRTSTAKQTGIRGYLALLENSR